ncbi:L-idonate 5-dehydrogenase [Nesterenkonia halophila]|uniref:zinc-binding dehydrogenase n=1 Tax=Nesterenkonia halophila TaxID=302044 RepID=UPI0012913068|nr:zinc-binding dehydrogenase [Nesterenkonia halophila]
MKAAVAHGAQDLRIDDHPRPTPAPDEVLVAVEWGGICGSDIAYVGSGVSGTAQLRQPLVLGHEVAGRVVECGSSAPADLDGRPVAVLPASIPEPAPEGQTAPRRHLDPRSRYLGSAAHSPHTDGGFRELLAIPAAQALPLPEGVSTRRGALAEPLAVALHAVNRAGTPLHDARPGSDVIVNGCGPIGLLIIAALAHRGAGHRIIATDISTHGLTQATRLGADETVDLSQTALSHEAPVVFEASGAPAALETALAATARGGRLVQVGNLPKTPSPAALGDLVSREITWLGSFRFEDEMDDAIRLLAEGLDVEPIISHEFPLSEAQGAFDAALDPSVPTSKIMLRIG